MADFSIGKVGKILGEVQRNYIWLFDFVPPSIVRDAMEGFDLKDNLLDHISIRCRSAVIPGRTFDVVTTKYAGIEQFFPTNVHYSNPFNVVFEEFEDKKIAAMLSSWQKLVINAVRNGQDKSEFAVNCYLDLLSIDIQNTKDKFKSIVLINAWPEVVAEVPLSYAESNSVQYSVSFRYDMWDYQ